MWGPPPQGGGDSPTPIAEFEPKTLKALLQLLDLVLPGDPIVDGRSLELSLEGQEVFAYKPRKGW